MRQLYAYIRSYLPHILICLVLLWCESIYGEWVTGIGGNSDLSGRSIIDPGTGGLEFTIERVALSLIRAAKTALNGVALLSLLYVGYLWVSSMGDEEKQSTGKKKILLIIIGLFLINIPELLYNIFTGGNYLNGDFSRKVTTFSSRDPWATINTWSLNQCNLLFCPQNFWWNGTVVAIIRLLESLMIVTAVVMFTWWGFMMVVRGGDEQVANTGKKRIIYGVIALLVIWFIESIYRSIFFGNALNASGFINAIMIGVNFFLFLAWPIAIVYLIVWAYFYITSGGDEERADRGKRILLYTVFAVILLLLAYAFLIEIVWLNLL